MCIRSLFPYLHQRLLRDTLGLTQHKRLISYILPLIEESPTKIIDIGVGDGVFTHLLAQAKPNAHIVGMEIHPREKCMVEVQLYNGIDLPFPDKHFDYSLLINVLHHAGDYENLLREAKRVSRKGIIIKDHYANNKLDYYTLVLMERIGNMFVSIDQPYNFFSEEEWKGLFSVFELHTARLLTKFISYNPFAVENMKVLLQWLYNNTLRKRRLKKITTILSRYLPEDGHILDLGCGDGALSNALKTQLPNIQFTGLDINPAPSSDIPILVYDGNIIPYPDQHFDYVMLITVLHHTDDYAPVLREAFRVSKKGLFIIDHQYNGILEWLTLAFIDTPGNIPFGVYTPFNFFTRSEWQALLSNWGAKKLNTTTGYICLVKHLIVCWGKKCILSAFWKNRRWHNNVFDYSKGISSQYVICTAGPIGSMPAPLSLRY
jgi:ubiquinone/menaquinone biosynthesis C-methylase UbiE